METFVVRIWRAADPEADNPETWPLPLRGFVKHVGTGAMTRFGGAEELVEFLRTPSGSSDPETAGHPMPSPRRRSP